MDSHTKKEQYLESEDGGANGRPRKVTKAQLQAAVCGSRGQRSVIAGELRISLRTLDRSLDRYPDVKQAYQDEREALREYCTDKALSNIYKALEDGDPATSRWVLDRLGGEYGFTPKQALTDPDGVQPYTMTVNININDSKIRDASE